MITKKDQLEVLVDRIEEERELMELWCWQRGVPYIDPFLTYLDGLVKLKREVEEESYVASNVG